MSVGHDLYADGFPHSTAEGYERGCRGSACPGKLEHGFSCSDAVTKGAGDFAFSKLVAAGKTPAEIAETLGLLGGGKPEPKEARKPKLVEAPAPKPVAVAEPVAAAVPAEPTGIRKESRVVGGLVHGSPGGYARGCRTDADCPNTPLSGYWTCRQANNDYQAGYRQRRLERQAAEAKTAAVSVPAPVVAESASAVAAEVPAVSDPAGSVSLATSALSVTLFPTADGGIEIRIDIPGAAA